MSDTESFESAARSYDNYTWIGRDGVKRAIDRLKAAHDREIRDTAQQQFARGFNDGRRSMDAEHRAIAMRLRGLRFDGGSHENLSRIAYAIYPCATGWTCESAAGLRDKLIDLMGGVSDDTCGAGCCCAAADCDGDCGLQREEVTDGRTADDCGGDTGGSYRGVSVHLDGLNDDDHTPSIAYELRGYVQDHECDHIVLLSMPPQDEYHISENGTRLLAIADRIDKQYDQLQAKLDEYDQTHVELPRDENGEVFHVDGGARVNDLVLTIRQMTLTKSGWKIRAYDEDYEVEREASFFDACVPKPDLIEEIIERLTLGEITQSEAIERIKSIGQE